MSCPSWCGIEYPHAVLHFGRVALLRNASGDVSVAVCQVVGRPVEVAVTVYEPGMGTPAPVNDEPSGLTPTAARTLGQALTARGRDTELGELLIQAADLLKEA